MHVPIHMYFRLYKTYTNSYLLNHLCWPEVQIHEFIFYLPFQVHRVVHITWIMHIAKCFPLQLGSFLVKNKPQFC